MTQSQILWTLGKILLMVIFLFSVGGALTWGDRRQSAMIQDRVGPNRAVIKFAGMEIRIFGLLHTAADGVKFFFKEDFIPPKADRLLFGLAPLIVMIPVLAITAVIPFGDTLCIPDLWRALPDGQTLFPAVGRYGVCAANAQAGIFPVDLMVAPLDVGILYIFALGGQGVVGAAIAGYSSNNKFSLLGAIRAASQMVSYEVVIGLSLVGAMMIYGTVRLDDMVRWQGEHAWGIFVQPLAFLLFFVAAVAETKRIPFDLPEAESELVSGYFTEYSGMKFGMFYFAEYMEIVTSSMLLVVIFLGGWQLPFIHRDGLTVELGSTMIARQALPHLVVSLIGVCAFFGKVLVVCVMQAFVRWSLPRFRYDQLMKLCWRALLPIALGNIAVTGVAYLAIDKAGTGVADALRVVGDGTQGLVAILLVAVTVWLVIGMVGKSRKQRDIVGTSATAIQHLGSTPETPMQA